MLVRLLTLSSWKRCRTMLSRWVNVVSSRLAIGADAIIWLPNWNHYVMLREREREMCECLVYFAFEINSELRISNRFPFRNTERYMDDDHHRSSAEHKIKQQFRVNWMKVVACSDKSSTMRLVERTYQFQDCCHFGALHTIHSPQGNNNVSHWIASLHARK